MASDLEFLHFHPQNKHTLFDLSRFKTQTAMKSGEDTDKTVSSRFKSSIDSIRGCIFNRFPLKSDKRAHFSSDGKQYKKYPFKKVENVTENVLEKSNQKLNTDINTE